MAANFFFCNILHVAVGILLSQKEPAVYLKDLEKKQSVNCTDKEQENGLNNILLIFSIQQIQF